MERRRPTDSVRITVFDVNDADRFLVVTEADDPGNWKLPGGKFEGDETPDEAADRELLEEVGLAGEQIGLQAAGTRLNDDGVSERHIYTGMAAAGDVRPSAEIAEAEWFTGDTLPDCKNRGHILGAVATARAFMEREV
jgi:ADP-ribose pyrophosphatase YjhB (NUDIX family)